MENYAADRIAKVINEETPDSVTAVVDEGTLIIESTYSEDVRKFRTTDIEDGMFLTSFMFASKQSGVGDAIDNL